MPAPQRRKVWLASFPRSGNTFLRSVLYRCFGIPSTSVYGKGDLGRNAALERFAGHFDPGCAPPETAPDMPLLVKTHRPPPDDAPAIYIVRDGRAATVSLWEFLGKRLPLRAVIKGHAGYGSWSDHLAAWRPWERPDTLLLRYDEMVDNLPAVLERLSGYLAMPILSHEAPGREEVAAIDGRWVRERSDWHRKIGTRDLRLLQAVNGDMLARLGYETRQLPAEPGGRGRRALRCVAESLYGPADWCAGMNFRLRLALRRRWAPRRRAR